MPADYTDIAREENVEQGYNGVSESRVLPPPSSRYRNKFLHFLSFITVEPSLTLYMLAFMITTVVEQNFYLYKSCLVNLGYNKTVCENLNKPENNDTKVHVQKYAATFHLWNGIAGHGFPIFLALFLGAWSDKRGRKLPILIGLLGKLYFSVMIIVNSVQEHWPVEYIIYTATIPTACSGADLAIFAAVFTYLVDITNPKDRTMRMTILEACYLATMPIGIALGSFLFNKVFDHSYTIMFTINASVMCLAIVYTALRLEWQSNPQQTPLSEGGNWFLDFFDYSHAMATVQTIVKKRPGNKRTYLCLLISMMGLYVFQREERDIMFMYCHLVFDWAVNKYSLFRTVQSALQALVLLFAVKLLGGVFGFRDTVIIMVGAMAHTTARIFYATANEPWLFYVGGVFSAFGPIAAPVIRSMVSKMVASSEKGKAFAVLAVADNAIPVLSSVCYSGLYQLIIPSHPEMIFYLTMVTQMGVFISISYIHCRTSKHELEHIIEDNKIIKDEKTEENEIIPEENQLVR